MNTFNAVQAFVVIVIILNSTMYYALRFGNFHNLGENKKKHLVTLLLLAKRQHETEYLP